MSVDFVFLVIWFLCVWFCFFLFMSFIWFVLIVAHPNLLIRCAPETKKNIGEQNIEQREKKVHIHYGLAFDSNSYTSLSDKLLTILLRKTIWRRQAYGSKMQYSTEKNTRTHIKSNIWMWFWGMNMDYARCCTRARSVIQTMCKIVISSVSVSGDWTEFMQLWNYYRSLKLVIFLWKSKYFIILFIEFLMCVIHKSKKIHFQS